MAAAYASAYASIKMWDAYATKALVEGVRGNVWDATSGYQREQEEAEREHKGRWSNW